MRDRPKRSAGFNTRDPSLLAAPSELRTQADYGVRQRRETRCEDDRASGYIVSMSMMSAQSSPRSSRKRVRREEIASRSAWSWIRMRRRSSRAPW